MLCGSVILTVRAFVVGVLDPGIASNSARLSLTSRIEEQGVETTSPEFVTASFKGPAWTFFSMGVGHSGERRKQRSLDCND